ncbi:iron complex transport system substrate-binding protein [Sinobacterium caligoides]|uniref:Iron complex transport system substrate-binding protein n=1 Tax=Sinobacterium caligoides TaxID=933926 RepID=A0A3N2DKN2_9GAMM|nr:ABC transporter substrate-binding protein [Sinobacterium caligoides]ROS00346.1 iron complex transport system substrate-binding protein [Sinobacterium caligoides]
MITASSSPRFSRLAKCVGFTALLTMTSAVQAAEQRIISTDAGSTDILLALDKGADLVGVDVTSVIPPQLKAAKLGYHRMLATEGVLSLNPNMVVGSEHMGPAETVAAIKKANIALLQLPAARDAKSLKENIVKISAFVHSEQQAKPLLQRIDQSMAKVAEHQLPPNSKVAFLLQMDGKGLRLAGQGTTGDDFIHLLGGESLGAHRGYQSVSAEALLSLQPDVIIVASRDMSRSPVAMLLEATPLLKHTPAGTQQRIVAVDGRQLVSGISLEAMDALVDVSAALNAAKPAS